MQSHNLILEDGPPELEWTLAWDETTLRLKTPDGEVVLEMPATAAHVLVDLHELFAEGRIGLISPHGMLLFQKDAEAVAAMRRLVEAGLCGDPESCAALRRQSLWGIAAGLLLFVVGGGLFTLYCWYATWAPDPPPGHWIRWFGWAIHGLLMVLMAACLLRPCLAWSGLRQWRRLRGIEQPAG